MERTDRLGLSLQQKKELWQRWKDGQSLSDIGRSLGKHAASVFGVLLAKGGIAPRARSRKAGSLAIWNLRKYRAAALLGLVIVILRGCLTVHPLSSVVRLPAMAAAKLTGR